MNTSFQQLLSERFEIAFNQIHGSLKKLAKNTTNDKFSALLRLSSHHRMIQAFQDELYQYAKLRNALVHEKKAAGYYIAEPHEEVVQRIENISKPSPSQTTRFPSPQRTSSPSTGRMTWMT